MQDALTVQTAIRNRARERGLIYTLMALSCQVLRLIDRSLMEYVVSGEWTMRSATAVCTVPWSPRCAVRRVHAARWRDVHHLDDAPSFPMRSHVRAFSFSTAIRHALYGARPPVSTSSIEIDGYDVTERGVARTDCDHWYVEKPGLRITWHYCDHLSAIIGTT